MKYGRAQGWRHCTEAGSAASLTYAAHTCGLPHDAGELQRHCAPTYARLQMRGTVRPSRSPHRPSIRSTNGSQQGDSSHSPYQNLHDPISQLPHCRHQILELGFGINVSAFISRLSEVAFTILDSRFHISDFTFLILGFATSNEDAYSSGQPPLPSHTRSEYVAQ